MKVRFASCKRSSTAHDLQTFAHHVNAFLQTNGHKHLANWDREMVLFSPLFSKGDRTHFQAKGYMTRDLVDYAQLFGNPPAAARPQ